MTLLPIVERELRVTARRAGIYRNRVLMPALLVVILFLQWVFIPTLISPGNMGRVVYEVLSYLAFVVCLLDGVRQTADCVSIERRDGTLGLLFLTDLNGYDVILGKLAAASLASLHGLLAMVPILGVALFLGGITPGEIVRIALALVSLLIFSLAMGLWVSSRSRSASHAMGGTLVLMLLFLTWPLASSDIAFLSPASAFFDASESGYTGHPLGYWTSLLVSQVFVVVLLARAAANTNRFREDEPGKPASSGLTALRETASGWKRRAALLDVNPVSWLARSKVATAIFIWLLVLLAMAAVAGFLFSNLVHPVAIRIVGDYATMFVVVLVVHLVLKVFLAARACRFLAEARRAGALELMLCTPLKVEEILRGQVLALIRTFLKPFLMVMVLEMIGIYWWLYQQVGVGSPGRPPAQGFFGIVVVVEVAFAVFFLLDIQSVAWNGMWFGLCSKNESMATFKTAFYIIVVPILILGLYCVGIVLFVGWPIAAYYWARLQLQEHFRFLAGLRAASTGNITQWLPFNVPGLPQEPRSD